MTEPRRSLNERFAQGAGFLSAIARTPRRAATLAARLTMRHGPMAMCRQALVLYRLYFVYQRAQYREWMTKCERLSDEDRAAIRRRMSQMVNPPLLSVVMPAYNPPLEYLRRAVESLRNQLYKNWELCIADDASTKASVRQAIEELCAQDPRVRCVFREKNGHISAASNSALELARGEFIVLLDQDDELPEQALYLVAEEIQSHPNADLIYSDEDKSDTAGRRFSPYFKPDWNWGQILSHNMFSHLGVLRTSLVREVGGFRLGYEGSQDYDLVLRCAERTSTDRIRHLPHVLYHWRMIEGSTALNASAKNYAFDAGRRAIQAHLERRGIAGNVGSGALPGLYRIRFTLPDPAPLVSVIRIQTGSERRNSSPIGSTYPQVEWIDETITGHENFISRLNQVIGAARGEVICILRNDTQAMDPHWLTEMVSIALQSEIGVVGAKLVSTSGDIRHAGFLIKADGSIADPCEGIPDGLPGPYAMCESLRDVQAVSGACMVFRRREFGDVGGLDPALAANDPWDVDFCLRVASQGKRILWTPYARLSVGKTDLKPGKLRNIDDASLPRNQAIRTAAFLNPNHALEECDFRLALDRPQDRPWLK